MHRDPRRTSLPRHCPLHTTTDITDTDTDSHQQHQQQPTVSKHWRHIRPPNETEIAVKWLIDWAVVWCPTQHKTGHFGDISSSQSLGLVWKKLNITRQKHTFAKQNKHNTTKNKHKKLKPCLVAFYHIRPGKGAGLFKQANNIYSAEINNRIKGALRLRSLLRHPEWKRSRSILNGRDKKGRK